MGNERIMEIANYDKNQFILSTASLNTEDFEKIDSIVDFFTVDNTASHNARNLMLRNSIITYALNANKVEDNFILKAIELSLIFADEAWRNKVADLNTYQRAIAFSTTEDNVVMFDALNSRRNKLEAIQKMNLK